MLHFHIALYAHPGREPTGDTIELRGVRVRALAIRTADCPGWALSFEEAVAAFQRLPRMFIEMDGSFVWRPNDAAGEQIDGVLFDRQGRVQYAEVRGTCSQGSWEQLLGACGWPSQLLVAELIREGVVVNEPDFRPWAAAESQ
jgi:hypothetical protein